MTQLSIQQALDAGLQFHSAGRLQDAEAIYRQVLASDPTNATALNLLGTIAYQLGQDELAVQLIRQALTEIPSYHDAWSNLCLPLGRLGRIDEAEVASRHALQLKPDFAEAHLNLGEVHRFRDRLDDAIECFETAVRLRPDLPIAHFSLGRALRLADRPREAVAPLARAIQLNPHDFSAIVNLGNAYQEMDQPEQALEIYRQAQALNPDDPELHGFVAIALSDLGRHDEALAAAQCEVRLAPDKSGGFDRLGMVLRRQQRTAEGIAAHETARDLAPQSFSPLAHLCQGYLSAGRFDEAVAAGQSAVTLKPNDHRVRWNMSLAMLSQGDFENGWREFEHRWRVKSYLDKNPPLPGPTWDGADLTGRTILLRCEQGLGDAIQFVRYAPLVAQRGGKVVIVSHLPLRSLLASVEGVDQVVAFGQPFPPFDVHCGLMSLPLVFGTTLADVPANVPYLHADVAKVQGWRSKVDGIARGSLKVGLAWAGNPNHADDVRRSMPLYTLASLAQVPGIEFFSLQKGAAAEQATPDGMTLHDFTAELVDVADTAALIANLDLIVSVDTAVAHLAGALAKPVWMLLPDPCDWRWLTARDDSPWYPTMTLFRQQTRGDWTDEVARVVAALRDLRSGPT